MEFLKIKNITSQSADIYVYGEICLDKDDYFGSQTDVTLLDFKEQLDTIKDIAILNIYINSPGGNVFVASNMVSLLKRYKVDNNVKIYAYVDGISASASSFFMMVADTIYLYKNSIVMIHKPLSCCYGNSNDMLKMVETLDKIEDSIMIPLYLDKMKNQDINSLKEMLANETWLNANDMLDIFEVDILDNDSQISACITPYIVNHYKNIPNNIKDKLKNEKNNKESLVVDKIKAIGSFLCQKRKDDLNE